MSSFTRFKELMQQRATAVKKANSYFVFRADNTVTLTLFNTQTTKTASVVSKQEQDIAYIYTQNPDTISLGTVWGAKGLYWVVADEIILIQDVNYHKYKAFLCNVSVAGTKGYFVGPEKTAINVAVRGNTVLQSQQKPILVMPGSSLNIGDKLVIKNRGWLIQEKDDISSDGVTYYTLVETTISKDLPASDTREQPDTTNKQTVTETADLSQTTIRISPNVPITITTIEGYFKSTSKMINITRHTETQVIFSMPFGVSSTEIEYKSNEGSIIKKTVEVI